MSNTALDILTREQVCRTCDASDFVDATGYLTCEHVADPFGQPLTCRLRAMLSNPAARCPSPDVEQARRWNDAATIADRGCRDALRTVSAATPAPDALTRRVRACLGHGDLPRCEHAGDGWACAVAGRSIAKDLKDPAFACPIGRFGAEGGKA